MECWDCGLSHLTADEALAIHNAKRTDLLRRMTKARDGVHNAEQAALISSLRTMLEEQDHIVNGLRAHDEIPPKQITL